MNKHRRKSIQKKTQAIFKKAQDREKVGGDHFETDPDFVDSETVPWNRNAYSVIISDLQDHNIILQASLPGLESAGIDIFEDGKHFADRMYNDVDECLDELSKVKWTYFRPKG
jgi:hypothetical protein